MSDDNEWIYAKEALVKVESFLGGRSEAKRAIAEHLRDGDIRTKAKKTWYSFESTANKCWQTKTGRIRIKENSEIEPRDFRNSVQWSLDQDDWRWPYNSFSITKSIAADGKPRRFMMSGVQFAREDINRILRKPNPSKGGSPGKPEQWVALWHALIGYAQEGRLNALQFPTATALRKEVLSDINSGLSDRSTTALISQVWKKFCDGNYPPLSDDAL